MAEVVDTFSFDKGINLRKNSAILGDGELQECSGFSLDTDGYIKPMRPRAKIDSTAYGEITNIYRHMNTVIMCEGANIRYAWDLRGYCDQYTPPDNDYTLVGTGYAGRYRIVPYQNWFYMANGHSNRAFYKNSLQLWGVANPSNACAGSAGAAGNPNGSYNLYYTFLIKFPDGTQYETAPSPPVTVSVTNQKISWTNIGTTTYTGSGVSISRKLYRYSSGLAATYYVTEIGDNTTTTYTDNVTDATLESNEQISTTAYNKPPDDIVDIELYLYRMFAIKESYLYWSEPYIPFGFKNTSNINVTGPGDNLTSVMYWGDQLYISSKSKWYRLSGSDPDTWGIKNTFADTGTINTYAVKATKYGIMGLNYDGLYLFDGSITKNVTEKKLGRELFLDGISDKSACYAEYDGLRYYFYYPESGSQLSKCLIADFTFYPEIRFYNDPFIATAHQYHQQTGRRYLARLDSTV